MYLTGRFGFSFLIKKGFLTLFLSLFVFILHSIVVFDAINRQSLFSWSGLNYY